MIGIPPVESLEKAIISGHIAKGLSAKTRDGRILQMALIDERGNIVEEGDAVANEAWNVAIGTYKDWMLGNGHLRVYYDSPCKPVI